jgi:hypothetical protein
MNCARVSSSGIPLPEQASGELSQDAVDYLVRQTYRQSDEALRARFAAEDEFRGNPDIEIVVLGARSWQALERTHSRYFKNLDQLIAMIGNSQPA